MALFLSFKVFIITLINQNMNAIELKLLIIFLLENIAGFVHNSDEFQTEYAQMRAVHGLQIDDCHFDEVLDVNKIAYLY